MRLLIVRHGEPNYTFDTLTTKGWREAKLLSERLAKTKMDAIYVSPHGRAKDTAFDTLKKLGRTATECEWLREFRAPVHKPSGEKKSHITWDWLPQDWVDQDLLYDKELWSTHPVMAADDVKAQYDWVITNFDQLLAKHGYVREGNFYRAVRPNHDTIVFFCHFGLESVLLSHLMNISPMIPWHHMCAAPTSVTTIYTEERREGIAVFRTQSFGDVSHLYAGDEEISFAARFCETYGDAEPRDLIYS